MLLCTIDLKCIVCVLKKRVKTHVHMHIEKVAIVRHEICAHGSKLPFRQTSAGLCCPVVERSLHKVC
jgi:hypothetical protein